MTLENYFTPPGLKFITGKMETLISMNWVAVKIKDDAVIVGGTGNGQPLGNSHFSSPGAVKYIHIPLFDFQRLFLPSPS